MFWPAWLNVTPANRFVSLPVSRLQAAGDSVTDVPEGVSVPDDAQGSGRDWITRDPATTFVIQPFSTVTEAFANVPFVRFELVRVRVVVQSALVVTVQSPHV
jgi:hypothetical protein